MSIPQSALDLETNIVNRRIFCQSVIFQKHEPFFQVIQLKSRTNGLLSNFQNILMDVETEFHTWLLFIFCSSLYNARLNWANIHIYQASQHKVYIKKYCNKYNVFETYVIMHGKYTRCQWKQVNQLLETWISFKTKN